MTNKIKKAFTLVELLVVIAILAILGTVGVVGYTSFIKKANTSADEQAVTQMNVVLQANEVLEGKTIKDLFNVFTENGIDAEDYKPLVKDTFFFWDKDLNRVVYTDKDYNVIWPEQYKDVQKEESHWLSLSGEINKTDYSISENALTLSNDEQKAGEQLYKLSEDIDSGDTEAKAISYINLPSKVDLAGCDFNLGEVSTNLTVSGDSSNKSTIENLFTSEYKSLGSGNRAQRKYSAGFVQTIPAGKTVTFENLIIDNATVGDYSISMSAIFAGRVSGDLIVKNCKISNVNIYTEQKGGAIAGYITGSGKVTITNCTFENVHVYTEEGCAGGIFGYNDTGKNDSIVFSDSDSKSSIKNNVTCELTKVSDRSYVEYPQSLTEAQTTAVSTFNSYTDRTKEFDQNNNQRYKPGCATYGWLKGTSYTNPEGKWYNNYGFKPYN